MKWKACRLQGNVSLAERAAMKLFELERNNPGNYDVGGKRVRELMKAGGIKREAGCSWIQIKNKVHTFVSGGGFEFRNSAEVKNIWKDLMDAMEEVGYILETSAALHDVNEETKAMWVCGYSERVALKFALVHTAAACRNTN
ncbi:pentatricopeptide repeat-containing protein [Pyrus ussuriensis x Pyrus communis]|uniref:Pentatricopeptide repeat-containing protein n=1 Tax=Pyrus ussuriensis x Pyrus communis TaxID=2448454 RepID=A0A5N5GB23_9ROSA|nr:pentatricopeptide repeat-containing protein [Pyrus ussuriensis x Pyrus communis]